MNLKPAESAEMPRKLFCQFPGCMETVSLSYGKMPIYSADYNSSDKYLTFIHTQCCRSLLNFVEDDTATLTQLSRGCELRVSRVSSLTSSVNALIPSRR